MPESFPARCRIIGVLDDGPASLDSLALGHIRAAELVIGNERTLSLFSDEFSPTATRRDLTGQLTAVVEWIRHALAEGRRVVVLATGDPLCHGIAGYLQSRLCIEACEILPNLSMVQLACARLGMPWQDMAIASIHRRDTGEWDENAGPGHGLYELLGKLQQHDRLAIYTSPANDPARIARLLLATGAADDWQMAVAEHLTRKDEHIHAALAIDTAATMRFQEPNIVILWRGRPRHSPLLFGLADDRFEQRRPDKGLITKREVRAVSLARLQLRSDSIVWDIGAGSGSVGLEAARLCPQGQVLAIEKNADDVAIIHRNQRQMDIHNYTLLADRAPAGLADWPDPDAIFIGGSGGELTPLISLCLQRLRTGGQLVMNFVTVENLATAIDTLQQQHAEWDFCQLQISRSRPILDMHRLAAENPVWIVSATPGETS